MTDETKGDGMTLDQVVVFLESELAVLEQSPMAHKIPGKIGDYSRAVAGAKANLADQSAMRVDEAMVERYAEAYWVSTRRASWQSLAEITREAQRQARSFHP